MLAEDILIRDVNSALDLIANVRYQHDCDGIIVQREAIVEEFFDLKTRLAGEILQKFANYQMKIAIIGDFTNVSSKSLRDFIYESNKGTQVFFLPSVEDALRKMA